MASVPATGSPVKGGVLNGLRLIAVLLVAVLVAPVSAPVGAQDGNGVIVVGNPGGSANLSLLPTQCAGGACHLIDSLLYPTLLYTDPASGLFTAAPTDSHALATAWQITRGHVEGGNITGEMVVTFTLRDDLDMERWHADYGLRCVLQLSCAAR